MTPVKKTKSRTMKRLPPNWGDNLTLGDIDWTIAHFQSCIEDYTEMLNHPFKTDADRTLAKNSLPIVQSRLALWQRCRATKLAGQSIMPLLRDDRK